MDVSMYHYDAVDSTNTQCRRLAAEGVVNAVVTADCQTAGRGRMGRSFQSPPGLGLYLSVLWRTRPAHRRAAHGHAAGGSGRVPAPLRRSAACTAASNGPTTCCWAAKRSAAS